MLTTRHFEEQVLRKRPELKRERCEWVIRKPIKKSAQIDERILYWGIIEEMDGRILRVITLEDGETIHNAFFDRDFKRKEQ